jgi:hypothetical protein
MSTFVLYTPENRLLDLAVLNERDFALISSLHGEIGRGDRILLCQQRTGKDSDGAEMFVRLRNNRYFAVHFAGGECTQTHEIARESDEHRRQKDYWQRAAEDAGYRASQEFRTGAGTILDVAIDGPRRTGIEVQHSALETRLAKTRTTKSFRAGWLPVWFLDSDHAPPWFHTVPALNCNRLSWSSLPPRRSATAVGATKFIARACTALNFGTCPTGGRKRPKPPCGQNHPQRVPWEGLTVDDAAAMIPAGEIMPMRDMHGNVHLVDHENLKRYQDLTGLSGDYLPSRSRTRGRPALRSSVCINPIHDHREDPSAKSCSKCGMAPAGPGGVLCPQCLDILQNRPASAYYDALLPHQR